MAAPKVKKVNKTWVLEELQPSMLTAELVGTFILTCAVIMSSGNVILAALTVLVLILTLGKLSGAHINPAVTFALFATRHISALKAFGFIVAQLFGAMLALVVMTKFAETASPSMLGQPTDLFKAAELMGTWRPFWAEFLGSLLFGLGIGAAVLGKKEGFEAAFTISGALMIGLVLASIGSSAILNPAVAMGISAFTQNIWTLIVYVGGSVLGVTLGAWLFKLLSGSLTSKKA